MSSSLQPASATPEIKIITGGYNNSNTTIIGGKFVAWDLDSGNDGRAFILPNTTKISCIAGLLL